MTESFVMSSQYRVALEFGYDSQRIKQVLEKKKFASAGDLIDFLEESEVEEYETKSGETELKKEEVEKIESLTQKLSLREETERLYRNAICLRCARKSRNILCLPCTHLSLCSDCASLTSTCPMCKTSILGTIVTYIAWVSAPWIHSFACSIYRCDSQYGDSQSEDFFV